MVKHCQYPSSLCSSRQVQLMTGYDCSRHSRWSMVSWPYDPADQKLALCSTVRDVRICVRNHYRTREVISSNRYRSMKWRDVGRKVPLQPWWDKGSEGESCFWSIVVKWENREGVKVRWGPYRWLSYGRSLTRAWPRCHMTTKVATIIPTEWHGYWGTEGVEWRSAM